MTQLNKRKLDMLTGRHATQKSKTMLSLQKKGNNPPPRSFCKVRNLYTCNTDSHKESILLFIFTLLNLILSFHASKFIRLASVIDPLQVLEKSH